MSRAGILVDEEFGAGILRDATRNGYVTALSIEKSGSDEFEFEYGEAFAEHIEAFDPTFAKVLVRYNPEDDAALNRRQTARLKQLSDYCRAADQLFMFELLVPATKAQMDRVQADKNAYDVRVRPELMLRTIRALQDAGVEPDVWKIEGLDRREDCERVVETARRDGRRDVGCIVLGRGADEKKVVSWLETAASVPGFIGFAVGRTTFWDAVADYEAEADDAAGGCVPVSPSASANGPRSSSGRLPLAKGNDEDQPAGRQAGPGRGADQRVPTRHVLLH